MSVGFPVGDDGEVTAELYLARETPKATLLYAHGAGTNQHHAFHVANATGLAARGVDVVTFDFLYSARGRRMPDPNAKLEACWRAAIASYRACRFGRSTPTARLACGGKSLGARIASQVVAADGGADALVFFGYPLHPPEKPQVRRDAHLPSVACPMLFVQGERDEFGSAREIRGLAKKLPLARVHVVRGVDHALAVTDAVRGAILDTVARFVSAP